MTVIVDTGPLVAAADRSDAWHAQCRRLLTDLSEPVVVPPPVLSEVCYLLQTGLGPRAEGLFLDAMVAGEVSIASFEYADLERATELVHQYADFPLGFVDATVVATAERLGVTRVATIDRRHFSVVRPRHVEALTLLP